jgi:hypothetical protein
MADIQLRIWRADPNSSGDQAVAEHRDRQDLVRALTQTPEVELRDSRNLDTAEPHEVAEVILAIGTAGGFTAVVGLVKAWFGRNKVGHCVLTTSAGSLDVSGATAEEIERLMAASGLPQGGS